MRYNANIMGGETPSPPVEQTGGLAQSAAANIAAKISPSLL
jgi:hypothetical protein